LFFFFIWFFVEEKIEGQVVCDDCDSEPTLQKPVKETSLKKTNDLQSLNVWANASKETSPKAIQILNIEELNSQIIIPPELNIIDCPEMVNSDINWFRNNFKNFWRLFTSKAEWVFIIHDRGTGKSKQTALHELYQIATNKDYEGCFIMRNREEPTRQTKEYFSKIILEFTETIWLGNRTVKDKFHLQWNSIWKGVQYKANPSDKKGDLRCHFLDLYSPEQARTLIKQAHPNYLLWWMYSYSESNQRRQGLEIRWARQVYGSGEKFRSTH
jgi:hypothetical protein